MAAKKTETQTDGRTDIQMDIKTNATKPAICKKQSTILLVFLLLLPILLEIRGKWLFGIRLSFHDNCGMLFVCIRKHINLILTNLVPYIWLTNRMNDWLTNWLNIWTNFHRMLFYFSLFVVNLTHLTRFWNF